MVYDLITEGRHPPLQLERLVEKIKYYLELYNDETLFTKQEKRVLYFMITQTAPRYSRYLISKYNHAFDKILAEEAAFHYVPGAACGEWMNNFSINHE